MTDRRLRVVVVNYRGGDLTLACLRSLLDAEPVDGVTQEVVLVDNASDDGVADRVAAELPGVRVLRSATNLGFAGGCNLGIGDLAGVDLVALVNNDAEVTPGWLGPLVAAIDADPEVGAAVPKLLFRAHYREVVLTADTAVRVSGAKLDDGTDIALQHVAGFGSWEPARRGSPWWRTFTGSAVIHLPVDEGPTGDHCQLRLGARHAVAVTARSGPATTTVAVGVDDAWHEVHLGGEPFAVINNVGTMVLADGYGADRGFQEPDRGQYDQPEDVTAWSGGAVVLRAAYLRDVGRFDGRLFLYYEDVDLALRGAAQGWHYRYVPASVVRHVHSASAVAGSALAEHYKERNRLALVGRHRGRLAAARAIAGYLLATASYARRDVVVPLLRGRRPRPAIVVRRVRAAIAALPLMSR